MATRTTTFRQDFRTFFVRGLIILLPTIITLALLTWAGRFLWSNVAEPINSAVRWGVVVATPHVVAKESWPDWYAVSGEQVEQVRAERVRAGELKASTDTIIMARDQLRIAREIRQQNLARVWNQRVYLQPIGLVVAVMLIYLVGVLVGNYLGRRTFVMFERWATRVPIVKQVYPSVKQIVDFLVGGGASSKSMLSGRVVAIQYPSPGIWALGLMTGDTVEAIQDAAGYECVTVFIPSSPTPFTGYTVTVARSAVVDLPLTLDEALRFVVSGGVVVPTWTKPRPGSAVGDLAAAAQGGKIALPGGDPTAPPVG